MVSAAAVAAWRLSDGQSGWGPPFEYLAALVLGLNRTAARAAPWAIGVDLGKTGDPTAIVVMRRISVDGPAAPFEDMPIAAKKDDDLSPAERILKLCGEENLRFAALGHMPTPEERVAHVAAIDKIKTGR